MNLFLGKGKGPVENEQELLHSAHSSSQSCHSICGQIHTLRQGPEVVLNETKGVTETEVRAIHQLPQDGEDPSCSFTIVPWRRSTGRGCFGKQCVFLHLWQHDPEGGDESADEIPNVVLYHLGGTTAKPFNWRLSVIAWVINCHYLATHSC